jgi:peptidoglycan/xylan/chitin deacetylase (PgdA/CDA1 family)
MVTTAHPRARAVRAAQAVLGSPPLSFTCSRAIAGLRVLAYHDIADDVAFGRHLALVRRHYRPVGADQVVAAVTERRSLPARAIWLTFDDGHPSTFAAGKALAAAGIPATVFICPSVVDTEQPLWWQLVDEAIRRQVLPAPYASDPAAFRAWLKTAPDAERRAEVDACRTALDNDCGSPFRVQQATSADLTQWAALGHHIGNHTWDHPMLDRCDATEQERQIVLAEQWLLARFPDQPKVFAYPNGNRTAHAEGVAAGLGYVVRALFDHRVARRLAPNRAVSRLRLDADAPPSRFRAIASGAHSGMFHLGRA